MAKNAVESFLEKYKTSPKKLAHLIGVDPSYISLITSGKRKVSDSIKYKIEKAEEQINAGEIHVNDREEDYGPAKGSHNRSASFEAKIRALYYEALGPLPEGFSYRSFPVEGASMNPTVRPGDVIVAKLISLEEIKDEWVYIFVIDKDDLNQYRKNGVWIKRVRYRKKWGHINCYSDNKESTEPYVTFRLYPPEVLEVWEPVRLSRSDFSDPNRDVYEQIDELRSRIEFIEAELNLENQ